jgi:lipopolysaccharide export system protein LptA
VISERDKTSVSGELRGAHIAYFTQPRTAQEQSQKVTLKCGVAQVDGKKLTFALRDSVDVTMEDGSRIEAPDLFVNYRLSQMTTKSAVRVTRPNAVLTGVGLDADDTLRQVTVMKDGAIEITGRPADLRTNGSPPPPEAMITRLRCAGPLSVRDLTLEIPGPRRYMRIDARDGVRIEREDPSRRVAATADDTLIYLARRKPPEGRESIEPVSLTLRGAISIDDSSGVQVRASTADWSLDDDLLHLGGAPQVEVVQGEQRVRARTAVVDRWAGRAIFRDDLVASLQTSAGSKPLEVRATELVLESSMAAGRPQASMIRATGSVRVTGDAGPQGGKIDATGDRFTWSVPGGRGALFGTPFARIVQGESRIDAPEIVFEGRSMFVVKGPKRIHLVNEKPQGAMEKVWEPGRRTEIAVATDGDVVYDGGAGIVRILDRSIVRSDGMRVSSDRLTILMAPDGQGISEVRGHGHVDVVRPDMRFVGDLLWYVPSSGKIEVRGEPHVVATMQGLETRNAIVRYDPSTGRVEAEGGRKRGRIEIPK